MTNLRIHYVGVAYLHKGSENKEQLTPRIISRMVRSESTTVELIFGEDYVTNPNLIVLYRVTGAHNREEAEGSVIKVLSMAGPGNSSSMWKSDNDVTVRRLK